MRQFPFLDDIYFHCKSGILTELWLTNPHNKIVVNYDYMLFILDDVKIESLDLSSMIEYKQRYRLHLLSPKIMNSTHKYMNMYHQKLTITNALEVYCLLMTPKDFSMYSKVNTIENKWMWGVDYLFGHLKLKTGIYNSSILHHKYRHSKEIANEAEPLMVSYLKKFGYHNIKEITDQYPIVIKHIDE